MKFGKSKRKASVFSRAYRLERLQSFGLLHCEGDGGGGGDKTFTQAEVTAAIKTATDLIEESTNGIKTKNQELLDSNASLKATAKKFENVNVEELLALQTKIAGDEVLSLLAEGKSSEAIDKATEVLRATHTTDLEKLNETITQLTESGQKNETQLHGLLIDSAVTNAFIEANGIKEGAPDVVLRAKLEWKVEEGKVVARDKEGELIKGEDGPITIKEWTEGLKKTAPHLFPESEGGLNRGGDGDGGGGEGGDDGLIAAAAKGSNALRAYKKKHGIK